MRMTKVFLIGLLFSMVRFGVPALYAEEHGKEQIQMLRDAAAALKATNPDLGEKLAKYAELEANEGEEEKKGKESEETEQANLKLLRDSAAALEATRPELADELREHAAKEEAEEDRRDQ